MFNLGMINVCVEVAPDLGLCIQCPITEVSGSNKEPQLHLAFCCVGAWVPACWQYHAGKLSRTQTLFTEGGLPTRQAMSLRRT